MADNRVKYIIDIVADDQKLRQQLAKLDWEKMLGADGKGIADVLASQAKDSANQIRSTLGGIDLDWGEILGKDEFKRIQQVMRKIISANADKIRAFAKTGDVSGIQQIIDYVSALGNEFTALGGSFDADGLVRSVNAFMKVLNPLATKIEALAKEPEKVKTAFDRIFSNSQNIDNVTKAVANLSVNFAAFTGDIEKKTAKVQRMKTALQELTTTDYKLTIDDSQLEAAFMEAGKKLDKLYDDEERTGKKHTVAINRLYAEMFAIEKRRAKLGLSSFLDDEWADEGNTNSQTMEYWAKSVEKTADRVRKSIAQLETDIKNVLGKSFAQVISEQVSEIKLSLKLQDEQTFINNINDYIVKINKKSGAFREIELPASVIGKTEDRFGKVENAITTKQDDIVGKTETWREKIIKAMSFNSKDFKFDFGDVGKSLYDALSSYFEDPNNKIKVQIDAIDLANQIKTAVESEGITLGGGGGTVALDGNSAMNFLATLLTGKSMVAPAGKNQAADSAEDATESTRRYARQLDESTIHIDKVIETLKDFAKKATGKNAAKGAVQLAERLGWYGIDVKAIAAMDNTEESKEVIIKMLQDGLMTIDEKTGLAKGSALGDIFTNQLKRYGLNFKKEGAGKVAYAFGQAINEMFKMAKLENVTEEQYQKRADTFEEAGFYLDGGQTLTALNKFRGRMNPYSTKKFDPSKMSISDIEAFINNIQSNENLNSVRDTLMAEEDSLTREIEQLKQNNANPTLIDQKIEDLAAVRREIDALDITYMQQLLEARKTLGDKTDEESLAKFQEVAHAFYEKSKALYTILNTQWANFEGDVKFNGKTLRFRRKGMSRYSAPGKSTQIPEGAAIQNITIYNGIESQAITGGNPYQEKMLNGVRPQIPEDPSEESKLRNKVIAKPFSPLEAPIINTDYDKAIENAQQNIISAEAQLEETKTKLAELDAQITKLDAEIASKKQLAKSMAVSMDPIEQTQVRSDRDEYEKQVKAIAEVEDFLKSGDTKKMSQQTLELYSDIPEFLQKISNLTADKGRIENQLKRVQSLKNKSQAQAQAEIDKHLKRIAEEDAEMERLRYHRDMGTLQNGEPEKLDKLEQEAVNRARFKSFLESYKEDPQKLEQTLLDKLNRIAEKITTTSNKIPQLLDEAKQKAQSKLAEITQVEGTVIEQYKDRMQKMYSDITNLESALGNPNLSDDDRNILIGRLQNTLELLKKLQSDYESFTKSTGKSNVLIEDTEVLNHINTLTSKYVDGMPSIAGALNGELSSLREQRGETSQTRRALDNSRESLETNRAQHEANLKRFQLQKQYQELIKREADLQAEIKQLEADGASVDVLKKKKEELIEINQQLEKIANNRSAAAKVYSGDERKSQALSEISRLQEQLIEARVQRSILDSRARSLHDDETEFKQYGLRAGFGADWLNTAKAEFIEKFKRDETGYIASEVDELRAKTKAAIEEAILALPISPDHDAEAARIKNEKWAEFRQQEKDLRKQLVQEFIDRFSEKDGVLTAVFKAMGTNGQYVDKIETNDVEKRIKDSLAYRKDRIKSQEDELGVNEVIKFILEQIEIAKQYGDVTRSEILDEEIIQEQIRLRTDKLHREDQRQKLLAEKQNLLDSGLTDDDATVKDINKQMQAIDEYIKDIDKLIENRDKLRELNRADRDGKKLTAEERQLLATEKLVKVKRQLFKTEELLKKLEKDYKAAKGTDQEMVALKNLNDAKAKQAQLQKTIEWETENIKKLGTAAKQEAAVKDSVGEGGLLGAIKGILSDFNINIDIGEGLATEKTLSSILALLGGTVPITSTSQDKGVSGNNSKNRTSTPSDKSSQGKNRGKDSRVDDIWNNKVKYDEDKLDFNTVKKRATELKSVIDSLYDEGKKDTEEYIKAQLELGDLLYAWRKNLSKNGHPDLFKIDGEKDNKPSNKRWQQYLTSGEDKLFDDLKKVPIFSIRKKNLKKMVAKLPPIELPVEVKPEAVTQAVDKATNTNKSKATDTSLEVKNLTEFKKKAQTLQKNIMSAKAGTEELRKAQEEFLNLLQNWAKNPKSKIKPGARKPDWIKYLTKTEKVFKKKDIDNQKVLLTQTQFRNVYGRNKSNQSGSGQTTAAPSTVATGTGILGTIGKLATEDTLANVLAALKDIAKKPGGLGGAKSTGGSSSDENGGSTAGTKPAAPAPLISEKAGINKVRAAARQYEQIVNTLPNGFDAKNSQQFNKYKTAYDELKASYKKYEKNISDPAVQNELGEQADKVRKLGKQFAAAVGESERLQEYVNRSGFYTNQKGDIIELGKTKKAPDNPRDMSEAMRQFAEEQLKASLTSVKFNARTQKLTGTLRQNNHIVSDMAVQYNKATGEMYLFQEKERESLAGLPGLVHGLKEKGKAIFQYIVSMTSIHRVFAELRRGLTYIKEIDIALTELRKVTDETEETYEKFLDTAGKTAYRLGSTLTEVTNATAEFAKLGYSMEMSAEMAEAALVYANVGDGIGSAQEAADSIISTLKGFKLEAEDSMLIVDKFNQVGNDFAITSKGIGDALMKSASALSVAGNTIDESVALITAANEVVQDPDSVGTALKTLTLRIRGLKTELKDAELDVENMANTTSSLQQKILGLTSGRVDIMASNDEFKSTTQILREMAGVWESLTDVQQAASLELLGGKRQANILAAILTNFDTVEDVIATSEGSAGSALEENEKRLDSFQGRLNQLTSTVQAKWNEALDVGLVKDAIQLFTKLIKTLDFEDSALLDIVHLLIKGLSNLFDLVGNNNFGYTLLSFLGADFARRKGLFAGLEFGQKTVEDLTEDIQNLNSEIATLKDKSQHQTGLDKWRTSKLIDKKTRLRDRKQRQLDKKLAQQQTAEQVDAMKMTPAQQQEVADSFDIGALKKKIGGRKGNITNRTKSLTKQGLTPEQIKEDPKIKQWTQDIEQYNEKLKQADGSLKQVSASTTQATTTTGANATATTANSVAQDGNEQQRREAGIVTDQQTADIQDNTNAQIQNKVATEQNTATQGKFKGKLKAIGSSLKDFAKGALQMVGTMLIMQGAMQLIDSIGSLFNKEDEIDTYEELHEHFDVVNSDLAEQKSELKSLETEFDTIQDQIREIQKLGSLSFTKQEELNNLKQQSAELERQIEMQKIITRNHQLKTNTAALDAATAYLGESAETDKARAEFIEEETEKTTKWTDSIGDILTGAGAVMAMIPAIGWVIGGITAAAGLATKFAGRAIAEGSAEKKYDAQQTNKQTIDNYAAKRAELQDEIDAAYAAGDTEKWKDAQQKLNDYEGMVAENMGQIQEYISSVDYSTLTEAEKERYEELNRILNKYSLTNGGSITNAVDSILDYDRFEQTGYQMDAVQNQLKNGDITSEDAAQQIENLIAQSPQLKAEFDALGITTDQVVKSFVQLGEAMREDSSLMDSLDKISAITGAFDELGSAVQEFREEGRASTGTLESLTEKFGELDEFEGLYQVLATGEGDLEGAIANVANAYVGQIQALSGLTDEEIQIMKSRLAAIGVLNADEVIMARQKGQQMLEDAGLTYGIDLQNYGTVEQAKVAIATAAGLNIADIGDDEIETMAKQYGVDLTNYATKEEQKIAIAQARAKATAEIDKADLKKKYDNKEIDYAEYASGVEKIESSINFSTNKDEIWSIVNNAFKDFTFNFDGQIGIGSNFDEKTGMSDEQSKAWENLLKKYQAELDFITHQKDLIQAEIDKAEANGFIASEKYYEDLIALEQEEQAALTAKQKAMQDFYDANSASMSTDEIDEWNAEMRETALAIKEAETNMIEFGNTIREIDAEYFGKVSEDIDAINEEIEFMHGLLEDEPVADESGNWSNEALTRLGLYTQQMEKAAFETQRAKDELAELQATTSDADKNTDWYREREEELTQAIYDNTNAYNDYKNGIVELNEARVEAIKEGIQKEIDAYNDLIENKKEALDAERDLYDFKKSLEEQNKSIAETERKLAALSGSTAAEDIAERKRLEAELREQQGNLDDTYYDHSMTAQQNALDEEGRYFEEAQNRRIESLEAMLENTEELIVNSMMDVMLNADTVHQTLNEQANTYGVTLSKELTQPWLNASAQAVKWRDELKRDMTEGEWAAMIGEGGAITAFSSGVATKLGGSWDTVKSKAKTYADFLTGNELKKNFSGAITTFTNQLQKIVDKWNEIRNAANAAVSVTPTVTGGYTGGGSGGNPTPSQNPTPTPKDKPKPKAMHAAGQLYARTVVPTALTSMHQTVNGITYVPIPGTDYYVKKNDAKFGSAPYGTTKYKYYAKGTMGTSSDGWAVTDESWIGEEITLAAGKNGQLQYLKKGSSVLPADVSARLMDLAQIPMGNFGNNIIKAVVPNIQTTNQAVNINFETLVKADNITNDVLPEVSKMVERQLDAFSKKLNYSLKLVGGR